MIPLDTLVVFFVASLLLCLAPGPDNIYPKVSIFFLAFLPQFADPGQGALSLQLLLLGGLFIIATLLVFGGIALLAGKLGQWLQRSEKAQLLINRVAGIVFVALALKLASTDR